MDNTEEGFQYVALPLQITFVPQFVLIQSLPHYYSEMIVTKVTHSSQPVQARIA
jgi:hypothetical protein